MSYDLMVFDPIKAPRDRADFLQWFEAQTEWSEDQGYEDASITAPALRAWYDEMKVTFVPMNGPDSPMKPDLPPESPLWEDNRVTGYTIGRDVIYVDFRWSAAEIAREAVVRLAEKHKVGFFDVSSGDGLFAFPGDKYI